MSRLEFRTAVEEVRPASAWVMVTVASATIWITGQLSPAVLAFQPAALVLSLLLRRHPFAWQRNAWVLNLLMGGVVVVTGLVATHSLPSTIALAHFASLSQALQLFDARARRSEFLLVVLALFQVVLASTLTDSVFFPPLLVAFVFSATWTLLVHTLRTEACEAGEPAAAATAITPSLVRMTLVAGSLSLIVALVLFVSLPRMRSSVLQVRGVGSGAALSGFSDRVELGSLGRIRKDLAVVLRVETLEGDAAPAEQAYWRGLAFDTFDGRHWSITPGLRQPVIGSPEIGVHLGPYGADHDLVQRVVREPVAAGVVFAAGQPRRLRGTPRRLERDVNGGIYAPLQLEERIRYTVSSATHRVPDTILARDRAAPPLVRGERYLGLPPLDPAIAALATRITQDAASDAERARRIETYLRTNGRYSDTPPVVPTDAARSPVEVFLLGETEGHCEYFATGMVVLARSLGIPARLVNGFAGGRENPIGGFVEVARADAHAWVEVHYAEAGWIRYDPTPPDRRLRAASDLSLGERLAQLGSALELWWFQRVVGFDRSDQIRALRAAWLTWRGDRRDPREANGRSAPRDGREDGRWKPDWAVRLPVRALALTAVAALGIALAWRHARRRSPRGDAVPDAYRRALRLLARRGLTRGDSVTARDFARRAHGALSDTAAAAFDDLTEAYLAVRFGAAPDSGALLADSLARLRCELRRPGADGPTAARGG